MFKTLMENVVNPILSNANEIIQEELKDEAASYLLRVLFVRYLSEHERGSILHAFYIGDARGKLVATITSKVEWKIRSLDTWGYDNPCQQILSLEGFWGDRFFLLWYTVLRPYHSGKDFASAYPYFLSSLQTPSEDVKRFVEVAGKALGKFSLNLLSEEKGEQTIFSKWVHRFFQTLESEIRGLMKRHGLVVDVVKVSHGYGSNYEMFSHPAFMYELAALRLVDVSIVFNHPTLGKMKVVIPVDLKSSHLFEKDVAGCIFWGVFLSPINSFLAGGEVSIYLARYNFITRSFGESFFRESLESGEEQEGVEPVTFGKKVAETLVNDLLEAFPVEVRRKPKAFFTLRTRSYEEDRLFGEAYFKAIKLSFKVAYGFCALLRAWLARKCNVSPSIIEVEIVPSLTSLNNALLYRDISTYYRVFLKARRRKGVDAVFGYYLGLLSDYDYQNPRKEPVQFFAIKCTLKFYRHFQNTEDVNEFIRSSAPISTKFYYQVENDDDSPKAFKGETEVSDTKESIKHAFLTIWNALDASVKETVQEA